MVRLAEMAIVLAVQSVRMRGRSAELDAYCDGAHPAHAERSEDQHPASPKGGVEGENGYYRRNHLVPLPKVRSWEELNTFLLEGSKRDEQRIIGERSQSVGAGMCLEREHLLPLAEEGFQLASIHFPTVNGGRCVRVLTNFYSVPAPGCQVQARVYAAEVELWHEGKCTARHDRCFASRSPSTPLSVAGGWTEVPLTR